MGVWKNASWPTSSAESSQPHSRSQIENGLIGQKPRQMQNGFGDFINLLNYWRDTSAHGQKAEIDEVEAFTSTLTLLRLAQYATGNWAELI